MGIHLTPFFCPALQMPRLRKFYKYGPKWGRYCMSSHWCFNLFKTSARVDYFNACLPEPLLKNALFPGLCLPVLPHKEANVSMTDGPHRSPQSQQTRGLLRQRENKVKKLPWKAPFSYPIWAFMGLSWLKSI